MKTIRTFFVNERNEIKRIPINFFNAWNNGEIALPEYRNQNVRLAVFIGEAQGKKLSEVRVAFFDSLRTDANGKIRQYNPARKKVRTLQPLPTSYKQTHKVKFLASNWIPTQEQMDEFYWQIFHKKL